MEASLIGSLFASGSKYSSSPLAFRQDMRVMNFPAARQ
jgi:hypothetical protein